MNNKENNELNASILLTHAIIRISSLEKVLLDKGLFTLEELEKINEETTAKVSQSVMDNIKSAGDKK